MLESFKTITQKFNSLEPKLESIEADAKTSKLRESPFSEALKPLEEG
jgi:hypothetical protein